MPHRTRKVPEVDWLAIRDEEGLPIDALAVEGCGWQHFVCLEQRNESKYMTVCNVSDICEIKHVVVVADLELGLPFAVGSDHLGEDLDIAFANDACRSDGAGEEVFWLAVGFEDGGFGVGLVLLASYYFAMLSINPIPLLLCSTQPARPQQRSAISRPR